MTMLRTLGYSILGMATACTTGTNKIAHAVCRQGIVIVGEISLVRPSALYRAVFHSAEAAEAYTAFGDFTLVQAKVAGNPGLSLRRILRQSVGLSGTRVNLFDLGPNFLKVGSDAICTEAYYV
jgi:hypothetical protein